MALGPFVDALGGHLEMACLAPRGIALDVCHGGGESDARTCQVLGLVATEIVFNAAKYAFGPDGGAIRLDLVRDEAARLRLTVADNGRGFDLVTDGPLNGSSILSRLVDTGALILEVESSDRGTQLVATLACAP